MNIKNTLFALCMAASSAGDEERTSACVLEMLKEFMPARADGNGNIIGENSGEGKNILLTAHLDTIGMVVTKIEENGFLRVDKCGGVDIRTLAAHDVVIHGSKDVYGVVTSTPPHLAKDGKTAADFDEMLIDTGIPDNEINDIIKIGDRVSFLTSYNQMLGDNVSGAYFDNNAGVCSILRCLEILRERGCNRKVTVLFAAQEETGHSGAVSFGFECDAEECIVVDVSFAKDSGTPKNITASLGGGVMIGTAPVLNRGMSCTLLDIAKQEKIPYQQEIMGGATGTDSEALAVSRGGKRTALLSVPLRNMHTPVEVVNLKDIESTAQLMAQYVINSGGVRL